MVGNNVGGDYKTFTKEVYEEEKTLEKIKWFQENGFEKISSIETCFEFDSLDLAKKIFQEIFGEKIALKINNKKLSLNIIIYKDGISVINI